MRPFFVSVCAVGIGVSLAGAQQISRKEPAVYAGTERAAERAARAPARPPGMRLALRPAREFLLTPLSEGELARLAEPGPRLKTGIRRALAPHALASSRVHHAAREAWSSFMIRVPPGGKRQRSRHISRHGCWRACRAGTTAL